MDAAAELGRNPVSKHQIQPEYGDEQADTGRDEPVSRDQILMHVRGQGDIIFPVQLTTSRIGNLTRLIHTLLYVMTIHIPGMCDHTYIHTHLGPPPNKESMAERTRGSQFGVSEHRMLRIEGNAVFHVLLNSEQFRTQGSAHRGYCPGGLSAVNVIDTQFRDLIDSGLTRRRLAV